MRLNAFARKEDGVYAINIPSLDIHTQAKTKKEIPTMIRDAVQTVVDIPIEVEPFDLDGMNIIKEWEYLYHVTGLETALVKAIVQVHQHEG